jgi:inward rectifier potassium channel
LRAIERRGVSRRGLSDIYHTLMTVRLSALAGILAAAFLALNIVFASAFYVAGGLAGVRAGSWAGAFFFSVQSLSTTGYGAIYPVSIAANLLVSLEIMTGLLGTAIATGIIFARLSRPRARVLFSKVIIVRTYQGTPTLMFRIVNERRNQIAEAMMSVTITRDEIDEDGSVLRRMVSLHLERDRSPVFALSWLVMHKITAGSPLFGKDVSEIAADGNVIICSFTGIDDTLNASIYARHVYGAEDLRFGHRFVDVVERRPNGDLSIDYGRFHDTRAEEILTGR